ncbi:MAG: TetR/AcrR family transcriptional regulator [Pseudonocardiaceae bacterium]
MRTTPTRSWRGVSAEGRRTERRALLIEAGLAVIGTQGWANTTVRTVCRQAGLTERYFYEAFSDRDALLLAVYDHVVTQGVAVVLEAVASAPTEFGATVRAVISAGVDLVTEDPRKGKVLTLEGTANARLQRRRQEAIRTQAALVSQMSGTVFGGSADPSDAHLNALAMVGALVEIGSAYLEGRLDISRERLIDHLTGLVVAAAGVTSSDG